ncbi:MAG TPA: response regulator [Beijerinckiaceae bacterium]|jgi:FixJ family two-component response regulator|nr:response regulator [Beijerinckiaceae bacterium]
MAGALQTNSADAKQLVFVIDDDADVREGLEALLQSVSLPCEVFSSTREFLNRKPSHTVSCLVLDVRLPGPSGLDFQTELAKAQIDIPIIFITGHGDIPMTVRAMKAGAVEFLTKPVREQDLLDAIRVALDRDRIRRERNDRLSELRTRFGTLSERERTVLSLVTSGMLNKQMAGKMNLSEVTVKVHRHNLMRKLAARSLPDLVKMAEALQINGKANA